MMEASSSLISSVFSPGADLWLAPERSHSQWAQKLDWYLNFQISRAEEHVRQPLSSALLDVLKESELPDFDWHSTTPNYLMIAAADLLPCRWLVVVESHQELKTWVQQALDIWKKMNSPSCQIFLPQGVGQAQFLKLWTSMGGPDTVRILADATSISDSKEGL